MQIVWTDYCPLHNMFRTLGVTSEHVPFYQHCFLPDRTEVL